MATKKSIEEIAAASAGESAEDSPNQNPDGVYVFRDKDGNILATQIVQNHPKFGTAQADAMIRVGYEFLRKATPEELVPRPITGEPKKDASSASVPADMVPKAQFDALEARLAALEGGAASAAPVETPPVEEEVEAPVADFPIDKPMKDWNKDQLTAKAVSMGIEVPVEATKAEIVTMIEAQPAPTE